jgi:cyclase
MVVGDIFNSRHFHIDQLREGVYAAINAAQGWPICNAETIDFGDRTMVFDTFTSPQAASDPRQAAEHFTGRAVGMLINSHDHNGHIWVTKHLSLRWK